MAGYPGTFFEWVDNSKIPEILDVAQTDNSPLFCAVFTADMGPEEFTTVVGENFFNLYGNTISFAKHGQPLLQAAMQINNGAKLYAKRVVASDATLACSCVYAKVASGVADAQLTDDNGQPLYWLQEYKKKSSVVGTPSTTDDFELVYVSTDPTIVDIDELKNLSEDKRKTTTDTEVAATDIEGVHLDKITLTAAVPNSTHTEVSYHKWTPTSSTGIKTINDAYSAFKTAVQKMNADEQDNDKNKFFPLFVFADNGRGESSKSWSISPDYEMSKNSLYMVYSATIKTPSKTESVYFTFNPNYVINGKSFCLQQRVADTTVQLKCKQFDQEMCDFANAIADAAKLSYDSVINQDVLFGRTRKNTELSTGIKFLSVVDDFAIDDAMGNTLEGGSNGSFGDYPINAESYASEFAEVFSEKHPEIYDLENNKFIAIFDANYPDVVKRAIEEVAMFREDFMFFRDFGTQYDTLDTILNYAEGQISDGGDGYLDTAIPDTKFIMPYCNYCDIQDPYTKKQITVTITYLLAIKFISHVATGQNLAFCGIRYGVTFPEIVPGTMNFMPSVTPGRNEKDEICDARINYCGCYNETYVMETNYTAQKEYTQFSFGCNVLATLAVIRAIRTRCPQTRYALATEDGLKAYEKDINDNIINAYSSWFEILTFEYVGDAITLANKRYYAAINVKFVDFIQSEYFKVTALPSVSA